MADEQSAPEDLRYRYRPSLIGAAWEFHLTESALHWSIGRQSGQIPYADFHKVQLSFRPGTMQEGSYVTYIWSQARPKVTIASTSRKSLMDVTRQDASYRDFILALHRHLVAAGARPEYVRGVKAYVYWPGIVIMTGASVGFVMLVVRALQTAAWAGAAFIAAFLALFLWQFGGYFRRNRPGVYRPDDVPLELLPAAKVRA